MKAHSRLCHPKIVPLATLLSMGVEHSTVVVDIFDDVTNSFCQNSKPLSNNTSFMEGCLGENVLLHSIWDMMIVPHVAGWVSRGEI